MALHQDAGPACSPRTFRVLGLGFRNYGLGFRVWGLGVTTEP